MQFAQVVDGGVELPLAAAALEAAHTEAQTTTRAAFKIKYSSSTLLGAAIATADSFEARLHFGRFVGMVSGEENTYFLRAFEALDVTEKQRAEVPDTKPTAGFKAIMREASTTRSYAAALSVLNVAEWLYLDWAMKVPQPLPTNFVHAEWITLHDNPDFRDFVAFLRAELDRVGPAEEKTSKDFFLRAVALERAFFDAAYESEG